ncbi:autotransporter family protein [Brucella anthropi]|uniref:autotransporter family protein n=1 Tax=Brucella anthropi TaxID=529 RepID=UPI001F26854C|nr:autotransporter outer membrane beta-barrel domain-containing protein [Brucella anthropi]
MSNTSSVIGSFAGAKGIVSVSGANSHWISSDNVTVGASGEGTLEISEQGRVQASGVELALDAGSIGTINIGTGGRAGLLDTPTVTGGAGEANVNFNHVEEIAFDPMLSGALDVHKDNTGATILMAENDYTGLTTIDGGILGAGAANVFSSNSDHIVNTNGMLVLGGFSQTVLNLANAGLVNMGIDTAPGTVLTVAGNYLGNDGAVHFNTVLGDDASATDLLVVAGDTSGSTSVKVTNAGGAGAQTVEGIKIIDVGGASEGSFTLLGDYETLDNKQAIRGGAYAYTLQHNGISTPDDGNWYLRSTFQEPPVEPGQPEEPGEPAEPGQPGTPRYDAGAPVYEAYPQALLALNGLPTLQQRVGNRVWAGNGNKVIAEGADVIGTPYAAPEETGTHIEGNGVWGRIEGAHNHIEVGRSTTDVDYDQNTFKMQAGVDGMLMENEIGKLIGGISVHYAHGLTKTASIYDAKTGGGRISTDGYGLGGTLTWYGENGLYIDAQAQATWYNSDLSYAGGNQSLIDGNDGFGYALSIEGGKRIALDPAWSLTPQAQLFYSSVDFDDFHDADNIAVRLDRGESLQGRLGLTLDHQTAWQNASGMLDRAHIYGIANLYYEFLEGTRVNIADVSFANRKDRLWGGIGLGGSYNWNEDKYSIYGEGLVNTSLNSFADSYSLQGNIGFRVKW